MATRSEGLTIDDVVRRRDGVLSSRIPGEMLAMDVDTGTCFAFGGPSARIWELLETAIRIGDLVDRLVGEYDIDATSCRDQTLAHLTRLRDEGVVAVVAPLRP